MGKHKMRCNQKLSSSDALCECRPVSKPKAGPGDASKKCDERSWPDKDHGIICGECQVLVNKFSSKYKTCDGYCNSIYKPSSKKGSHCVAAWEESGDSCRVKHAMVCHQTLRSSDALCQCDPKVGGAKICDESKWPDKDHGTDCGECRVLVNKFNSKYKTCEGYCKKIGMGKCVGAWEESGDTCKVKHTMKCNTQLSSSDAICQCAPPAPGSGKLCNEKAFPDKDHGLVCGECKVLVNKFSSKYKTCSGYCNSIYTPKNKATSCVGAWEESGDTCKVAHKMTCDTKLASSDAICECNPKVGGANVCNEAKWPDKDHGIVCGECKVLVHKFNSKYKTCDGYCKAVFRPSFKKGSYCVGVWEEFGDTCKVK